jgi:carboxyl-terminal processing protease
MTTGTTGKPATLGVAGSNGPSGGVLIHRVDKGGSAAGAGLAVGDELLSINGKACASQQQVAAAIAESGGAGTTVKVVVLRKREKIELPVTLREKKKVMSLDFDESDSVLEKKITP